MHSTSRNSWRLSNTYGWPHKLEEVDFTLDVLEVTGQKNGEKIAAQWFFKEEYEEAVKLLRTLDVGHIWASKGQPSIYGMLTGYRKRINLNNLDCIYRPR
jgi:hypothetical protein